MSPLPILTSQPLLNLPNKTVDDPSTNENLHTIERWANEALKPYSLEILDPNTFLVVNGAVLVNKTWQRSHILRDTTIDSTHPNGAIFGINGTKEFTIPINGDYNFSFTGEWDMANHSGSSRDVQLRKIIYPSGTDVPELVHSTPNTAPHGYMSFSIERYCTARDRFYIAFVNDAAVNVNFNAASDYSIRFHIARRGA